MNRKLRKDIVTGAAVAVSALLIAVNKKTFVDTGGLYPGGIAGLSVLLQRFFGNVFRISLPFSLFNLLLNAVPVYIGFRFLGRRFTLFSCLLVVLNSVITDLIPQRIVTQDILLLSVFGGIVQGFAIALCLNAGATTGGTDFITVFLSEKRGTDAFGLMLGFEVLVLLAAGLLFGWEKALYSVIFQYASTAVVRLMYRKYQQSTLLIVTTEPAAVCDVINRISCHSATVFCGTGAFRHGERNLVYSVVSAAESGKVIRGIRLADPAAFINTVRTQRISGQFYLPKEL